ncbi:uncharacterized protein Taf3 isoform X1 [Drosophila kikkawai]|uniref:Uncharacterized protein Taf3 isoform X1 n=1 Tax=Drosophila kikkawai TaxID=30033 RepID=A0A6P4JFL2_DROKI
MTDKYSSDLCRIVIAQISQTIGYNCTLSAPLELLQDVMLKFMLEFARDLHGHMEHANRLEPSVKDARHSLKSLNINIQELLDYIGNVEPVGFTRDVPQFPIKRASNMNFLKPGSAETLTRPIHIFEYLPPMKKSECRETEKAESTQKLDDLGVNSEISDKLGCFNHQNIESQSPNPARLYFPSSNNNSNVDSDQNRSSMWELNSVVMTTGGFISPAIEGKLPEAVVPDIIEEYKGLDAPPIESLIPQSLAGSAKLETLSKKIKTPLPELEIDNGKQISESITTTKESSDSSLFNNNNIPTPKASSKKNKKQKDDSSRDENDSKQKEKAQRRAMKLYQKLAKNQSNESQMLNFKKSKKSADGNKAQQLEKLIRKQAKQRQKQLKGLTIDDKSLNCMENHEKIFAPESLVTENPVFVESSTELISAVPASQYEIEQTLGPILSEAKKTCEPERNKLDIFKKITKQKTGLPLSNTIGKPIITGSTPIISLPSGTTITPANAQTPLPSPLISLNPETTIRNCNITESRPSSEVNPINMLVKSKKRGRKPGGKNQIKPTNLSTSQSLITFPNSINSANLSTEQPLNLSNFTDQKVNLISKNLILKEKKEKKKGKLKYETPSLTGDKNSNEINKNIMFTSPEKISLTKINVVHDQFVTPPNPTVTPIYSANQGGAGAGMVAMPLLPLLHFPPQPGLIPSGPPPGLFPGVVSGLVGFGGGSNPNKVGIPPFFAFSGPPNTSSVAVKDDDASNSDQLKLFRQTSSENRNYCNVAPLIPPDSIKLTECGEVACVSTNVDSSYALTMQKGKATGNLGDPIEVSDEDSDEAIEKGRMPETPQSFQDKSQLDLSNILAIPDKKIKGPVKLSLITSASSTSATSISAKSQFSPRFQLPTFMGGGDKFSLAGGADLIPLSRVDCGSAYSSQKVPSNSLTAQHYTNDDHQSFLPKFPTYEDITITPTGVASSTDLKLRKHHKKLKKIKEGKVKKKKDKKEKSKEKDLFFNGSMSTTSDKSDKKKLKKKKDKQQTTSIIQIPDDDGDGVLPLTNNIVERGPAPNLFVGATPTTAISPKSPPTPSPSPTQIPKLTLKLSGKSTPLPLTGETMDNETPPTIQRERDHSPELARFSPLVTGPPKTKQSDPITVTANPPLLTNIAGNSPVNPTVVQIPSLVPGPTNARNLHPPMAASSSGWMSTSNNSTHTHTSATSTLSASSVLLPQQLMLMTTTNPKPNINNFPSTNVATGTTGRTPTSNSSAENSLQIVETKNHNRPSSYVDAEGNRIWICPACGKVDDGSAMIGCDGCDAWYHWICVGITIAPKDNDDWFCRVCITKKKVGSSDKKSKKRNKKK